LLWALRLDEGCYQSVGMGKPYGYGRMKLNIDELREMDAGKLYRYEGLAVSAEKSSSDAVSTYINCYDAFAAEKLYLKKPKKKPSIHSLDEIQDFFFLHSTIRQTDEVSYMKLDEYKNNRDRLPIIAKVRETAKPVEQVDAPPADDPYAALRAKFKKL
jgi:hypothetical protein